MVSRIFQLKITLEGIRPPIWRRVLVESSIRLDELHLIIQEVMPWENYHLHCFQSNENTYSPVISDDDLFDFGTPDQDETLVTIDQVLTNEKSWIRYTYDMGDGWDHQVVLEKILAPDPKLKYPTCIKGKRACPPEDCGGAWGYMDMLDTLSDPSHPDYAEVMEWRGEIDAEAFDLNQINQRLLNID